MTQARQEAAGTIKVTRDRYYLWVQGNVVCVALRDCAKESVGHMPWMAGHVSLAISGCVWLVLGVWTTDYSGGCILL